MRSAGRFQHREPREQVLAVEVGQIVCPRRGIVDLELCFVCSRFRGFQEGSPEGLVCAYESVLGIPDFNWETNAASRPVDTGR